MSINSAHTTRGSASLDQFVPRPRALLYRTPDSVKCRCRCGEEYEMTLGQLGLTRNLEPKCPLCAESLIDSNEAAAAYCPGCDKVFRLVDASEGGGR